jgi:hypothetical protein
MGTCGWWPFTILLKFLFKIKEGIESKNKWLVDTLENHSIDEVFILCDKMLVKKILVFFGCRTKGFDIKFAFSGTRINQKFYCRIRAILNFAGLKNESRNGIWDKFVATTTYLSNVPSVGDRIQVNLAIILMRSYSDVKYSFKYMVRYLVQFNLSNTHFFQVQLCIFSSILVLKLLNGFPTCSYVGTYLNI